MDQLPIHFFTIALNGDPFIQYHIDIFKSLNMPWHWHIVEGVAELKHDTGWSIQQGGRIPDGFHNQGRSIDGTTSYLDSIKNQYPDNITIYRKPAGVFWDGKREMVNAPLDNINKEALLFQIDCDELWTREQITKLHSMFTEQPDKTAAWFWCWYFVTPTLLLSSRNCYAATPGHEWIRAWRYTPGSRWEAHEPPRLIAPNGFDIGQVNPFKHLETETAGLIFQHFSYVIEEQLRFKELYYGYTDAVSSWKNLQKATQFPVLLKDYFPWIKDSAVAEPADRLGVQPIMTDFSHKLSPEQISKNISSPDKESAQTPWSPRPLPSSFELSTSNKKTIVIDGAYFQVSKAGISRTWDHLLKEWSKTPFASQILVLDRNNTAPRYPNIRYRTIEAFEFGAMDYQKDLLEKICQEEQADAFASTYYTSTHTFPSLLLIYDMIPEICNFNLQEPQWIEKHQAIKTASRFLCISENTRKDLHRFFPELAPEKSQVCYLAADTSIFYPSNAQEIINFHNSHNITRPYFIMIGATADYKNGTMMLEALQQIPTQHAFAVVFVSGNMHQGILQLYPTGTEYHQVKLSDDDLRAAYSGAISLVYPSTYEGFGLPVLEAMACSCPVITTPFSSLPEVAGDSALLIRDAGELADALCEVQKPSVRNRLMSKGIERVKKFSWKETAREFEKQLTETALLKRK